MSEPTIAGDLALKIHADARGIEQEVAQSFGAAERAAKASGTRMVGAADSVRAAQLRILATTHQMARTSNETALGQERLLRLGAALTRQYAELGVVQERAATRAVAPARGIGVGGVVGLLGATFVAEKIVSAARSGTRAAAQLQAAQQQTETTLTDTGDAAGITAEHIDTLAQAEARASGVSRTHVIAAQNLLATYTAIDNQRIFDRAARASVDLATAFARAHGTSVDVSAQARTLGIALQDPLHGLDRLRRSGVAFTEQQREQVKALAASGQTLQAQTLILDLVNQKVGGSAQAFGRTAAGAAARAREAYEEFSISLAKNVLPVATAALNQLVGIFDFFDQHKGIRDAVLALGGLATALYAVHKAEQAIAVLRKSELLSIGARLLGYRSLQRAETQLAAAEDRHAESSAAAAATERAQTTAMVGSTVAAETETVAQGTLLSRVLGRGRGIVAGGTGTASTGLVGRLGGATAIGLGGQLAGGLISSQVGGRAGHEAGSVVSDTATGAAIGTLIEPGLGTAVGAGLGAAFAERSRIASFFGGLGVSAVPSGPPITTPQERNAAFEQQLADRHRQLSAALEAGVAPARAARIAEQLLEVQHEQLSTAAYKAASASASQAQAAQDAADRNVATARDFLNQVQAGNAQALAQVEQQTGALPGLFEGAQDAPAQQEAAAKALQRQGDTAMSVQLAEARLAEVRAKKGGPSAYALLAAEDALRKAKEQDATASDNAAKAESKASDARAATGLSIKQVMLTAAESVASTQEQAAAASRLVAEGISAPVLAQLEQLDQKAPGTLIRVAQGSTRAYVRTLNRDYSMREAARKALDSAWGRANLQDQEILAHAAGARASALYVRALNSGLKSPEARQMILATLSALLGLQAPGGPSALPGLKIPGLRPPPNASLGTAGLPFAPIVVNGNVTLSTQGKVSGPVHASRTLSTPVPFN